MPIDHWERFLDYARFARAKPTFDAEDRDKPLAVADALRAMLAEAARGGDWPALAAQAARCARFSDLEVPGRSRWFNDWARADADLLAGALAEVSAGAERGPVERFERFARAAADAPAVDHGRDEERALALITGSMLNFALAPLEVPVVRPGYYGSLERLLGYDTGAGQPLPERYSRHLEFAAAVRAGLEREGIEIRDMLDVQGLVLSAARHLQFWNEGQEHRGPPVDRRAGSWRDEPNFCYLALCAIYRDEAPYLREWIEFHRLVGVERFFLYDNRSGDDHLSVLAPYVESGEVVVHDWHPYLGQIAAYEHCIRRYGPEARWIGFIDVDEFLFSPTRAPLGETLRAFEDHPGVAVNWAVFGTSGHVDPPAGLVIESYLERIDHPDSHWYKSIVDPSRVVGCDVHHFHYDSGSAVDENGYPASLGWTKSVTRSLLRLNHYVTKSEAEHARRRARLSATGIRHYVDLGRWESAPTVRDEAILAYLDPLRGALKR